MDIESIKSLKEQFPIPTYEGWKNVTIDSLKGKPFEKAMFTGTYEGITIEPIYTSEKHSSERLSIPILNNDWIICQKINLDEPEKAIKRLQSATVEFKPGLIFSGDVNNLRNVTNGIDLNGCPLYIEPGTNLESYEQIINLLKNLNVTHGELKSDIFGECLTKTTKQIPKKEHFESLSNNVKYIDSELPQLKSIAINGIAIGNNGANAVHEIAYVIAQLNEYLRQLTDVGLDEAFVSSKMRVQISIGPDFFIEIAKIRALRALFGYVLSEYAVDDLIVPIHAENSLINKPGLDPFNNMIRGTSEAMSAALGGIDSLYIQPYDAPLDLDSDLGFRISRNTQLILKEEAHFLDTINPADGSWYVESLTKQLAEQAWEEFRAIEKVGGFLESLKKGIPQKRIEEIKDLRIDKLNKRRDVLIGVNKFPNFKDTIDQNFKLQKSLNLSAGFTRLRFNAEEYLKKYGNRPPVYLVNYGKLNDFKARNDFAYDFFRTGGFETFSSLAFDNFIEAARDILHNDYRVIVLCSSDKLYPSFAPMLSELVKKQKPLVKIILAGYPKEHIEDFKRAKIDDFIHIKSDVYTFLEDLQKELELF